MAELRPEVAEALKRLCAPFDPFITDSPLSISGSLGDARIAAAELQRLTDENARLVAERDALRQQIPTVDELHALGRCHKSQEVLRAQLDKANPDNPYASLMVAEDAMLLAGLIERFHAAQR